MMHLIPFSHKFQTVVDCISQIPKSNPETVIMSVCVVTFMIFMNEMLKVSKITSEDCCQIFQLNLRIFFYLPLSFISHDVPSCANFRSPPN